MNTSEDIIKRPGKREEDFTSTLSFSEFVFRRSRKLILLSLVISVLYFVLLRFLFPVPSYYMDSYTWVGAAKNNQPVSFRPIGYSKLIQLFKLLSTSDLALIAAQYFTNVVANLFLFFSCIYLFRFTKLTKVVLFTLLILNPLYVFYSNYVYADAFFCSLTVVWFTLLTWMIYTCSYRYVLLQLVMMVILLMLRSNAIIYPVISSIAILLCRQSVLKKVLLVSLNFIVIFLVIFQVTKTTQSYTGTKTFSAFSGWQLANNSMHVLRYKKADSIHIADKQTRDVVRYVRRYFDTASYIPSDATAWYMWDARSPLKKYMSVDDASRNRNFTKWNALGPVYSKFGKAIILQYPFTYVRHFIVPNTKAYFLPSPEVYDMYMAGSDTIATVAVNYYKYQSNKTPPDHPVISSVVFKPWRYIFPLVNFLFIALVGWFFFTKRYKQYNAVFNKTLLCCCVLYLGNFFFVVMLAPSVLRYHIFILTLAFPFTLYLLQQGKWKRICNN